MPDPQPHGAPCRHQAHFIPNLTRSLLLLSAIANLRGHGVGVGIALPTQELQYRG